MTYLFDIDLQWPIYVEIQNTLGRHASHYQNKHKPLAYIPCHNNHLFKVLVWMMSVPAGLSDFRLSKHNQYTYNNQVNDITFLG